MTHADEDNIEPRDINFDKAVAYNDKQMASGAFTDEMIAVLVAAWQSTHGLLADGMCGPSTQASLSTLIDDRDDPPPAKWPAFDGPLVYSPKSRTEVYDLFGNPGVGAVDGAWEKANIVTTRDMPGIPSKWYFQCHKLVEPYMREGLRRAKLAAPSYVIERAASFVFRHMRYDPSMPLSYHSWGIAIDIDPDRNFAKTFKPATATPAPWSPAWNAIWPKGLPQAFVEAMESVGFRWGGRWKGFCDPMHFEWLKSDVPV